MRFAEDIPRAFEFVASPSARNGLALSDGKTVLHISGYIIGRRPRELSKRFANLWVGDWVPALQQMFADGEFLYRFKVSRKAQEGYTKIIMDTTRGIDCEDWSRVRIPRSSTGYYWYDAPCGVVMFWLLGMSIDSPSRQLPRTLWVRMTRHRVVMLDTHTPRVRRKKTPPLSAVKLTRLALNAIDRLKKGLSK